MNKPDKIREKIKARLQTVGTDKKISEPTSNPDTARKRVIDALHPPEARRASMTSWEAYVEGKVKGKV
jgi:hypothetical protein